MRGGVLILGWRSFKSIVNHVLRLLHETLPFSLGHSVSKKSLEGAKDCVVTSKCLVGLGLLKVVACVVLGE